jgi:hypothetical protein
VELEDQKDVSGGIGLRPVQTRACSDQRRRTMMLDTGLRGHPAVDVFQADDVFLVELTERHLSLSAD